MTYVSILGHDAKIGHGVMKAAFIEDVWTANIGVHRDLKFNLAVNVCLIDPLPARDGKELYVSFSKAFHASQDIEITEIFGNLGVLEEMVGIENFLQAGAVAGRLARELLTIEKPQEVYIYAGANGPANRFLDAFSSELQKLDFEMRAVDSYLGQTLWIGMPLKL
jgi:hypothetical protein